MPFGSVSSTSRNSAKVFHRHSMPASIASSEMSSARWRLRMTRCRSSLAQGASVKPQLPITTVVIPCQQEQVPKGSQKIWASMWVWPSTKPGATTWPSASKTSLADSRMRPMAAILPPLTPTSARYRGRPDPSTTQPFLIRRSKAIDPLLFDAGVHRSIVASWYSTARSLLQRPFLVPLPRDGPRDLRPSRPSGRAGARALREPAAPPGEVRRGGLLLVSPGRASRDAAGPGPRARHLPRRGHPAHPSDPFGPLRVLPAPLRSAAADRGGVHARPSLAGPLRLRRGPRHRALRDGVLRPPPSGDRGDLRGDAGDRPAGPDQRDPRASRNPLPLSKSPHGAPA